jgi:hypothetical protein
MNICYGEKIEMQKWVSNAIAPIGVILLIFYTILYFASDYISKPIINFMNICIILMLICCLGLGVYSIARAASITLDTINTSWDILSQQSKIYYYDNDVNVLFKTYQQKMFTTGGLFILLGAMSILLVCFSYTYYGRLENDWRPPLRARLSDERAQRYIELYSKFNKDYKRLSMMENYNSKRGSENKIKDIIDGVVVDPNSQNIQQAKIEYQEVNKINDEFNVDNNLENIQQVPDLEEKKKKRGINLRRNRKDDQQNQVDEKANLNN